MEHLLDNPVWNALITGNAALAMGEGEVKYFPADISPFVGLKAVNPANLSELYQRMTPGRAVAIKVRQPFDLPPEWKTIVQIQAYQMVSATPAAAAAIEAAPAIAPAPAIVTAPAIATAPTKAPSIREPGGHPLLIPLGDQHVPAMLELTALTNPGPFAQRTILFGSYFGIFDGDQLVAMAGFRMHPGDFIEISAVCTRPGYNGRGYARALITHLIGLIRSKNCTPFLHVRSDNTRAVEVYRQLGFEVRNEMSITFFKKNIPARNEIA